MKQDRIVSLLFSWIFFCFTEMKLRSSEVTKI